MIAGPFILIIEDEAELAYSLRQTLQAAGYQAATAVTGFEAMEVLQTVRPAGIVLDLRLPGLSCVELLQQVRQRAPGARILAVTGHAEEYDQVVTQFGVADVLQKPVTLETLLARVTALVPLPVPPTV